MSFSNYLSTTKGKITIGLILSIIIISGLIYYFMYGSTDARYTTQSKKIISLVESGSKDTISTYPLLTDDTKNIDKIINKLKSSADDLDKAIKIADTVKIPDKYKATHESLKQGLHKNKQLYTQSIAILENYSSTTVNNSINKLYEYLSLTLGYYNNFKTDSLSINLPNEFINYPDKFKKYIENLNSLDSSLKNQEENNIYIANIKESLTVFNNIKSLVDSDIKLANDGKLTSSQLMVNISKHKNSLTSLIDSINTTNAPTQLSNIKTSFITCSVAYEDYLSTLRGALESSTESDNKSQISSAISSSADKLKAFEDSYLSLENILKEKQLPKE
ncbi:MAG: hypothetical protein RR840_05200 [Clostridium sp.]